MRTWPLLALIVVVDCNSTDARELSQDAGRLGKSVTKAAGNAQLAARVNATLANRKGIDLSGLHVEAEKGVVTVGGHVRNAAEKARVVETAEGVRGVDRVIDRLRIKAR